MTFVAVCLLLELVLRTEYSQHHWFGVYGDLPPRLEPSLNWLGLRDVHHLVEKQPGIIRVLVLGDSLTYGQGVADEEIYVPQLAALAGARVEVINLSGRGWSTADELDALRYLGIGYQPDVVVVGVVSNDPEPPGDLSSGLTPEWRILTRVCSRLQACRFIDFQINRLADQMNLRYSYQDWERDLYDPEGEVFKQWQQAVAEFGEYLASRNVKAYAFTLPGPGALQTVELSAHKYEVLTQEFAAAGFKAINLWPAFEQNFGSTPWRQLKALPNDAHPGPALHDFYARSIWQVLEPDLRMLVGE